MVAPVIGGLAAVGFAILFYVYQARRFRRAAAVVPELYDWTSMFQFGAAKG